MIKIPKHTDWIQDNPFSQGGGIEMAPLDQQVHSVYCQAQLQFQLKLQLIRKLSELYFPIIQPPDHPVKVQLDNLS